MERDQTERHGDVDAQLRRVAAQLDAEPDRRTAGQAAGEVLAKLDRLQTELDRLLGGLRSTAASLREHVPPAGARSSDAAGARLVAREMARAGTPRAQTARFLAAHYAVADLDALLDDVYASADG